jgi:O-antigen ligase
MKRRRALVPYLVGLIVVAALFAVIPQTYKERQSRWFESLLSGRTEVATGGSRGFIYRSALDIFKRSPIIGIGPRTFGIIYQSEYGYKAKGAAARAGAVHSGFLEILVENGILGFGIFLAFIFGTFTLFKATGRLTRAPGMTGIAVLNDVYEASFLALIVSGAFETIVKNNGFFIGAAAAVCLHRVALARARRLQSEYPLTPEPVRTVDAQAAPPFLSYNRN